jgi:hypothetical protein
LPITIADVDVRQAGVRELSENVVADQTVLVQRGCEVALSEPVALPAVQDSETEPSGVDFLTH